MDNDKPQALVPHPSANREGDEAHEAPDTRIHAAAEIEKFVSAPLTKDALLAIADTVEDTIMGDAQRGLDNSIVISSQGTFPDLEGRPLAHYTIPEALVEPLITTPGMFGNNKHRAAIAVVGAFMAREAPEIRDDIVMMNAKGRAISKQNTRNVSLETYAYALKTLSDNIEWSSLEEADEFQRAATRAIAAGAEELNLASLPANLPFAENIQYLERQ